MNRPRYRPRCPQPDVGSRADWGRASRDLATDPGMIHLAHTYWARTPPDSLELTSAERAALLQPCFGSDFAVAGISAAQLWGIPLSTGMRWSHEILREEPRHQVLDPRPQLAFTGARHSQGRRDVVLRQGLGLPLENGLWGAQITGALETLLAIQPMLPGWKSVAAIDHILATGLSYADPRWPLSPESFRHLVEQLPPYTRGAGALRTALQRCAPNVWSPMETLLRLILLDAGLPEPTPNLLVHLPDGSKAYLDLGWENERVGVEYNGAVHYQDRQVYGDEMHRLAQFKRMGWDVHITVLADLSQRRRREAMILELRNALRR